MKNNKQPIVIEREDMSNKITKHKLNDGQRVEPVKKGKTKCAND